MRWIPIILMVVIIALFSSQPYKDQNVQPYLKKVVDENQLRESLPDVSFKYTGSVISAKETPYRFVEFFIRKGMHLTLYGLLGLAGLFAFRRVGVSLLLVIIVASLDEWNQSIHGGRTGTPLDVGVDLIGAVLLFGLYSLIRGRGTHA
jgi:VanZ family protein